MFINEVENKVGLSKKSIRYYEQNGLLKVTRNKNNDYRIYTDDDIEILKKIKFLRELGVPIRDLKMLESGTLDLTKCLNERISKIIKEQQNFQKIKDMCEDIIKNNTTYDNFNIENYFVEISRLNKEGFTMRNIKTNKIKKIMGAIFSSLIFSLIFITILGVIFYFQIVDNNKLPWLLFCILVILLSIPILGMIYNLILRIKEILGGEEDEASKY